MNARHENPTTADLVVRCEQNAVRARSKFVAYDGGSEPGNRTNCRGLSRDTSESLETPVAHVDNDRFAGSDIAELDLFDATQYGNGRTCQACGDSISGQRNDARFCCDHCRVSSWRSAKKGPHAHEA